MGGDRGGGRGQPSSPVIWFKKLFKTIDAIKCFSSEVQIHFLLIARKTDLKTISQQTMKFADTPVSLRRLEASLSLSLSGATCRRSLYPLLLRQGHRQHRGPPGHAVPGGASVCCPRPGGVQVSLRVLVLVHCESWSWSTRSNPTLSTNIQHHSHPLFKLVYYLPLYNIMFWLPCNIWKLLVL